MHKLHFYDIICKTSSIKR